MEHHYLNFLPQITLQDGTFLAREDVTFSDLSENEYDSFEFIFGDGTRSDIRRETVRIQ